MRPLAILILEEEVLTTDNDELIREFEAGCITANSHPSGAQKWCPGCFKQWYAMVFSVSVSAKGRDADGFNARKQHFNSMYQHHHVPR